ncbi:MAG: hypothetical protein K2X11_10905 [Acetobacteraceae bacterium]|nr:hypothetical protein [Acetobacteraceae bacterium]
MLLPWDALQAGLGIRAGLEGWAPLPMLGLAGLLTLLLPALMLAALHVRRAVLGADAPGLAEQAEGALVAAADARRLRLIGVVCGLIGLLFLLIAIEATQAVALRLVAGLFLGATAFLAFALRCFVLARRR